MPRISTPLPCGEARPPRTDGVGPRIGSLFSGYGGLEQGVQAVLGGHAVWHSEIDPGACKILAHRYPDVPNLGDITAADWSQVEPVDVLTGGFPCQDVSCAGLRKGLRPDTRSGLWTQFAYAIDQLRPGLVVIENVRGLLSADAHHPAHSDLEPCHWCVGDGDRRPLRALGAVLGELADLGYDASWQGLRASDVGAPHGRFRVFVVAWPAADASGGGLSWESKELHHTAQQAAEQDRHLGSKRHAVGRDREVAPHAADDGRERGRPSRVGRDGSADHGDAAADTEGNGWHEGGTESARLERGSHDALGGASAAADADRNGLEGVGGLIAVGRDVDGCGGADTAWGQYEPAIRRWERVLGRPAPAPTELGAKGNARLSPRFVEFLMGLPAGWVTGVPALSRNEQLKALGNGVVPQQAAQALRMLLPDVQAVAA